MKTYRLLPTTLCVVAVYGLCVWVRIDIRKSIEVEHGSVPFTMESALLFHYASLIATGQSVPRIDVRAQHPEGMNPRERLSLTPDQILGFVYRRFFPRLPFDEFLRTAQPAVLCTAVLIVFWVVMRLSGSLTAAVMASLLYGLSINTAVRSTGLEYSRENLALPMLFLHFALEGFGKRSDRSGRFMRLCAPAALASALLTWDGAQVYFVVWSLWEWLCVMFQKPGQLRRDTSNVAFHLAFLIPAALLHPYLRSHFFLYSPGMTLLYNAMLFGTLKRPRPVLMLFGVVLCSVMVFYSPYTDTYRHMVELVYYKLKHLNAKPLNPGTLPFDVRILWTPALHAAPLQRVRDTLPVLVPALIAAVIALRRLRRDIFFLLFFSIAFFIVFLFFVRFEVYLIFFLACLLGHLPFGQFPQRRKSALTWNSGLFLALLIGTENLTNDFSRFARPVLYSQLDEVIQWVKWNTPRQSIVLANFGLSPSILAYADRGIALHTKYESADIREKVRHFAYAIFDISEDEFYRYTRSIAAQYYVHALGTYQDVSPYSWRYMVNCLEEKEKQPIAARFEFVRAMRRFYPTFANSKYIVYRVISPEEFRLASELKNRGDKMLQETLMANAELSYETALELTPNDFSLYFRLAKLFSARGQRDKALQATKKGLAIAADLERP